MTTANPRARAFGLTSATSLVIANMIGAGVFTTSGYSLSALGSRPLVLTAWCIGGGIALCGAISYGRLVSRITESGGEYLFLSRIVHPLAGFLAGWISLLAGFTGAIALAARTFETYALAGAPPPAGLPAGALGVAAILVFGVLHSLIARAGLATQNAVVLVKLVLLGAFLVYATALFPAGRWVGPSVAIEERSFALLPFASSLIWISLSYCGFNASVYIAGEVTDAQRTVPRSLWLGTLIVTAVYLALNAVFLYAPAPDAIASREDVATIVAEALGGGWLAWLVRLSICLALLSSISSMIVAGPRVYARMAEDGVFPRWFRQAAPRAGSPPSRSAVLFQTALAALVASFVGLLNLLSYLGLTLSLSAAGAVACVFAKSPSPLPREGRYRAVAALYIVATVTLATLAAFEQPKQLLAAAVTFASGVLVYFAFARRPAQDEATTRDERHSR